MKNLLFVILSFTIFSCNQGNSGNTGNMNASNRDSLVASLMRADKNWNTTSLQKGYFHSRIDYVADNGIELSNGEMPIVGKAAITDYVTMHADSNLVVQWQTLRGDVSASGDMGYTYGTYSNKMKNKAGRDTVTYGAYITVWQRQPDGSWKFLADGGVDTPQEVK